MSADSDQPETRSIANGPQQKTERWKRTKAVGCWIAASVQKPDNMPVYLGAIFTGFLAVFAFYAWREARNSTSAIQSQLCVMRQQFAAEENRFRLDERPLLGSDFKQVPQELTKGPDYNTKGLPNKLIWNYGVKNFGKSPALNITYYEYVRVFQGPFKGVQNGHARTNSEVMPGEGFYSTATYGNDISDPEATKAYETRGGIVLKVIVRYTDMSGYPFESILCSRHVAGATFANCVEQNPDIAHTPVISPPPKFLSPRAAAIHCQSQ